MTEDHPETGTPERISPWNIPVRYGDAAAVQGLASVAAPLLAGFAFTLVALILQSDRALRWPEVALLLLAIAAVGFLMVIQFAAWARAFYVTPSELYEWWGDNPTPMARDRMERDQRRYSEAHKCWNNRARYVFNVSLILFLGSLAVVLVPPRDISVGRWLALAIVATAFVLEVVWFILNVRRRKPAWYMKIARLGPQSHEEADDARPTPEPPS